MKKEAISHSVWDDLANRNENWDKLDGVPEKVDELDESRLILKNEIVNGDFSDGTVGWSVLPTWTVEDNTLFIDLTKNTFGQIDKKLAVNVGHKYYSSAEYYCSVNDANLTVLEGTFTGTTNSTVKSINTWERLSIHFSVVSVNEMTLRVLQTSFRNQEVDIRIKNINFIDLTATFGAGNEPTKEQMDIIMDIVGYFNGTHKITSKEQFNVLLKMVRENTLATTSLGGGF